MKIIPPNTAEWVAARRGILTASRMADAMPGKNGKIKVAGETLARRILAERRTGNAAESFVTDAMQWGIDNEAAAVERYEIATGNFCETAGLVMHQTIEGFAATPDRFVFGGGLVEVKCPQTHTHIDYILSNKLPDEYAPQVWAQLACTGEPWCDFVSFDPRSQFECDRLFFYRVERDEAKVAEVEDAARTFLAYVAELESRLNQRNQCLISTK